MFIQDYVAGLAAYKEIRNVYTLRRIKSVRIGRFVFNHNVYYGTFRIAILWNGREEKGRKLFINNLPIKRIKKALIAAGGDISTINKLVEILKANDWSNRGISQL